MKILGVDPGSNKIGLALLTLDSNLNIIGVETKAITMKVDKTTLRHPFVRPIQVRLNIIYNEFNMFIDEHEPQFVLFESGFIFGSRPGSIIPLSKALGVMEMILTSKRPMIPSSLMSPKSVKKKFTGNGNASKDSMADKAKELYGKLVGPNTTEDEYDALGIVSTLYYSILKRPSILEIYIDSLV